MRDLFHREYKTLNAVDDISLSINEGELIGYIGPNGAGKSTSIKMLTGILQPTSGEMNVLGFHPFRDRKIYTQQIGVVFGQRTQLWWDIAVIESLKLLRQIYRVSEQDFKKRMEVLNEVLGLKEFLHTPVRKLSLGQRMRSDLAASLIHNPRILFLDEPTIGLDAVAKDSIRAFLRYVNREYKTTILLTTHDLFEIEELCARIVVIDHGKIVYDGALSAIKTLPGLEHSIEIEFVKEANCAGLNSAFDGRVRFGSRGERSVVGKYDPRVIPTADVLREILSRFEIADLTVKEANIDEVIMKLYREGVSTS